MARRRYPSDEKRDRPYARIHLTTRTHPTYGHVFADPFWRGIVYGLWQVARGAYAGETDDTVTLPLADVEWITGAAGRHAVDRLRKVCDMMDYTLAILDADGEHAPSTPGADAKRTPSARRLRYRVKVRNLERKQSSRYAERRSKSKRKINEEEKEKERPRGTRKRAPSADAVHFAEDYRKALDQTGNMRRKLTDSAFDRWKVEADRMLRRDGIELEEARELCAWIFRSEDEEARFWRATARSLPAFRRNYDQINAQRERAKGGRDARGEGARAAARIARRRGLDAGGDGGPVVDVRGDAGRLPAPEEPGGGDDT